MPEEAKDYRPQIPTWAALGAIGVAAAALLLLAVVLFRGTTGPGEVVLTFYKDAASGDCAAAMELLGPSADGATHGVAESLCGSGQLPESPRVDSVTLDGPEGDADRSEVVVKSGDSKVTWKLERVGNDWLICGVPKG
ncbi:MAG: hypothetical protein MUP92_00045 [Actinobacteria bacterium]|nr:hypothetical protein [Actinomycetota bacterium]